MNKQGDIKLHCYQTNDFENKVKAQYPEYSGLNYLDMISGMFFHKISKKENYTKISV